MKILLVGGGSGGPVTPVLAVALEIKKLKPKTEFLFVGTRSGPEKEMVREVGINFKSIPAARLRRFISIKNLFAPFIFLYSFLRAVFVVKKFKPDVIFSAGSFVQVPICWAGKFFKVKIVIHQQDARIGLANKLVKPIADQITTAFEQTSKDFYSGSGLDPRKLKPVADWVGNPFRADLLHSSVGIKSYFKLHDNLPLLLVLGGATGAKQINDMLKKILPDLIESHQVIHQTGRGKNNLKFKHPNYHSYELISFAQYAEILRLAHLVIARAGMSTITELSALGKPAIIIPMPKTHQEYNAKILDETHAAVILNGTDATAENLEKVINSLKFNPKRTEALSENIKRLMPKDAAEKLAKIVIKNAEYKA